MRLVSRYVAGLFLIWPLVLSGCSGGKGNADSKKQEKTVSDKAAQAIRGYAQEPMDRARATQHMGDDRTEAIDQAVNQ